ncbi:MAG: metallophosphoesterase [Planctomycetia bacterium]|nr:metallophosphoesterase [Planctomycetia bacterium]
MKRGDKNNSNKKKLSRRRFLRRAGLVVVGAAVATGVWSLIEPRWLAVTHPRIVVPGLPGEFDGLKIALLTDIHHSSSFSLKRVVKTVRLANTLGADVIALCGDYVTGQGGKGKRYIAPCIDALAELHAPMGVFAVLGNHDAWADAAFTRRRLESAGIDDLTNSGLWLRRGVARLRLAGVGDLWTERQDLSSALGDASDDDVAVVLAHNPDYMEEMSDSRVGLVLSGHTHGGQIYLPILGAPIVPSRYGQKYRAGLVRTPHSQVYVSRGIGLIKPAVRLFCRPELPVITLAAAG